MIQLANKILELDPKNVDAWIDKATSTFGLTTGGNNRYDEAMQYLAKASQVAPNDARIQQARVSLTASQAWWYTVLGNEIWEQAIKWYHIKRNAYQQMGSWTAGTDAKKETSEDAVKAINHYLQASHYAPNDLTILENIQHCAEFYDVVTWTDVVRRKINHLQWLRAKADSQKYLPGWKVELARLQDELARLQAQRGFMVERRTKDTENKSDRRRQRLPGTNPSWLTLGNDS